MHKDEQARKRRRDRYLVLLLFALALAAGRIASATSDEGDTAFMSANDRSRWATVAALSEDGTYAIDRLIQIEDETGKRRPFDTIDKVRHRGQNGKLHYYSSKPPLFPTLVAGVAWFIHLFSGLQVSADPLYAPRVILIFVNLPLLALFIATSFASIERITASNWTRYALSLAVIGGTMVLPFAMTLNNHLVAVAFTSLVTYIYLMSAEKNDETVSDQSTFVQLEWYFLAGFAAAFVAANELPALSMFVLWFLLFRMIDMRSVIPFLGGALVVVIGFFGTNWIAHESIRPAYGHRGTGWYITEFESSAEPPSDAIVESKLKRGNTIGLDSEVSIQESDEKDRWLVRSSEDELFALIRDTPEKWSLYYWDDWYEYPGSYWQAGQRKGVDKGEASIPRYFFNMTLGSYGIFSLTPIWLLLPWGFRSGMNHGPYDFRRFTLCVLIASVVCILFYLVRPTIDRNYGGVSCCFRWVLWFAPMWLIMIAPIVDVMAETPRGRGIFMTLLALSVFSVSASLNSPWQSPWIYRFWDFLGWIAN